MTLFGTKEPHPADARRMRKERLASSDALVTMALAIRGTDFAPGTAEADIRFARELGLLASFHVACAKHGPRPQSMHSLAEQRLLSEDINLVHANFLTADEFRVVANNGASIPSLQKLKCKWAWGSRLYRSSTRRPRQIQYRDRCRNRREHRHVYPNALSHPNTAGTYNDTFHQREAMPDRLAITVQQALELATIKSANFGLDGRLGSLTPGKEADVLLLRKSDINMRAAADPISAIVLHAGVANVDTVIVGGNVVKQNGEAHLPRPAATPR